MPAHQISQLCPLLSSACSVLQILPLLLNMTKCARFSLLFNHYKLLLSPLYYILVQLFFLSVCLWIYI